jgi:hypothetical protein
VTRDTVVYIGGEYDYLTLKNYRQAILDYGRAIGLPELKSEHYHEETVPGDQLDEALRRCADGSVFITVSLACFGQRPSQQRQRILALLGRGVDVHVLGLGRVDEHLAVLKNCWSVFAALEDQLNEAERTLAEERERLEQRMSSFEDRLVARMSDKLGHGAVKAFYNGHAEPIPDVVTSPPSDPVAAHVKELRTAKNWTQENLAAKAGVSVSMVKRIETSGKGDVARVLNVLEHTT